MTIFTFGWEEVSKIGKSKLSKSAVFWLAFVPIAAKAASLLGDVATISLFGACVDISLKLPFSWKAFYFSSLFIFIGHIIYSVKCPPIIRDYTSYSDFFDTGKNKYQISTYLKNLVMEARGKELPKIMLYDDRQKQGTNETLRMPTYYINHDQWRSTLEEIPDALSANNINFWAIRQCSSLLRKPSLAACCLSYLAGFVLIGYVIAQNACYVYGLIF